MLSNRLAVITGSSSGIGLSVARLFARQGADLALVDMQPAAATGADFTQELKQLNPNIAVTSYTCDVSQSSQVNETFAAVERDHASRHACANVVVNSAGIIRDNMLLEMSEADFDKVIAVNLKGTFLVTQRAARTLIAERKKKAAAEAAAGLPKTRSALATSSFINLASVVGKYGNLGQTNYSASKAGVEGLTRTTAKELAKYGIRCNAILPGFIKTPMTSKVKPEHLEMLVRMIPMRRLGSPDDIAQLALFLASDASSYITGTSIECAGGMAF